MRYTKLALALFVAASGFFGMLSEPAVGQAITAKVVGTVTDPTAAAVPGAAVIITNSQTSRSRTTSTNEVGNHEFSFLPIGPYRLSVEADGFQTAAVARFELVVDQVARIDVEMQVGQITETVEV